MPSLLPPRWNDELVIQRSAHSLHSEPLLWSLCSFLVNTKCKILCTVHCRKGALVRGCLRQFRHFVMHLIWNCWGMKLSHYHSQSQIKNSIWPSTTATEDYKRVKSPKTLANIHCLMQRMKQWLHLGMNIWHAPIFPDATLELTGTFSAFLNEFGLWALAGRSEVRTRARRGFIRDCWGEEEAGGQRSLFLFQLDRIGTQALGEETFWAVTAREGVIKPVSEREKRYFEDWHTLSRRSVKQLDDWVPAHNPITALQIQSSSVALWEDTLLYQI